MKSAFLCFVLLGSSLACWAQPQTKSQCVATLKARSMSISSADAEKICSEDSADIGNCVISKMQSSHRGGMSAALTDCRKESQWNSPTPTPSPSPKAGGPSPTPSPTTSPTVKPEGSAKPLKVPVDEASESFEEI